MAALILLVSTLVALLSQTINAEPVPIVTSPGLPNPNTLPYPNIPYPFSPYDGFCPGFGQYPPFHIHCPCDLGSCFDVRTEAQLHQIANAYRLRSCDVEQWAAIVEGTMYGIDDYYTLSMVDQVAQSVRYEMDQRDLVYDMDYPAYCNRLYSQYSAPGAPVVDPLNPVAPVLTKRSPDVTYPDMLASNTVSPAAMQSYYYELMYMARHAMPYLSPQLQENLYYSILYNAPYSYLGLVDDVDEKLERNIRSMFSEMDDITPINPLYM